MKLAIFDIDGTLTLGDGLGTRCFFSVFDEVFGEGPRQVVYVGDQPWDQRAAREAGAAFVGIGKGEPARRLQREGAQVAGDYLDAGLLLALLEEAVER